MDNAYTLTFYMLTINWANPWYIFWAVTNDSPVRADVSCLDALRIVPQNKNKMQRAGDGTEIDQTE